MKNFSKKFSPSLSLFFLASVFSACGPVQGYKGPERPKSEVALISYQLEPAEVEVGEGRIGESTFSSEGITLLPGDISVDLLVTFKDPPTRCRNYVEFDSYGYRRCLDHEYSYRNAPICNRADYETRYQACDRQVYDAKCHAQLKIVSGGEYKLHIIKSEGLALEGQKPNMGQVTIERTGKNEPEGYGTCDPGLARVRTETQYLGRGRY
jgi:hypothetical protein